MLMLLFPPLASSYSTLVLLSGVCALITAKGAKKQGGGQKFAVGKAEGRPPLLLLLLPSNSHGDLFLRPLSFFFFCSSSSSSNSGLNGKPWEVDGVLLDYLFFSSFFILTKK